MKQHAIGVVPDTVRETCPLLTPGGLTGATDGFAMTALCITGLLGKMDYAGQLDAWRSSRQGFQRATNTGGSRIKGDPYSVTDAAKRQDCAGRRGRGEATASAKRGMTCS